MLSYRFCHKIRASPNILQCFTPNVICHDWSFKLLDFSNVTNAGIYGCHQTFLFCFLCVCSCVKVWFTILYMHSTNLQQQRFLSHWLTGQQYDKNGIRWMMWSNESQAEFKRRLPCFIDQYNQYTFEGVQVIMVVLLWFFLQVVMFDWPQKTKFCTHQH